jgi:hypothetical protein
MAISTPTVLTQLGQTTTSATITSASVSPAANSLLIVCAGGTHSAGSTLSVAITDALSGGSLTWNDVEHTIGASNSANTVIAWAICGATPGSGAITATWSVSHARRSLFVIQVATGFDTTTPIRQSKVNAQTGGTTLTITLDSTPLAGSLVIGAVEHRQGTVATATPGGNFTTLGTQQNAGTGTALHVQYDNASATTAVDWSTLSNVAAAGVAIEIQEPTASGIVGAASITLSALTLSATGTLPIVGTASIALAALTSTATGVVPIVGAASITLGALTSTATGVVPIVGTSSITLGALTLVATGTLTSTGAASITLDALTLTATGALAIKGTASITLGALTLVAGNEPIQTQAGFIYGPSPTALIYGPSATVVLFGPSPTALVYGPSPTGVVYGPSPTATVEG